MKRESCNPKNQIILYILIQALRIQGYEGYEGFRAVDDLNQKLYET